MTAILIVFRTLLKIGHQVGPGYEHSEAFYVAETFEKCPILFKVRPPARKPYPPACKPYGLEAGLEAASESKRRRFSKVSKLSKIKAPYNWHMKSRIPRP